MLYLLNLFRFTVQQLYICSVEETTLCGLQVRLGTVCRIALWECLGNSLVLLAVMRLHRTPNRAKIRLLKQSHSAIRHNTVLIANSQSPNDGGLGFKIRGEMHGVAIRREVGMR